MGVIHIKGDYYIRKDDYCYTLCQKYKAKDKHGVWSDQYRSLTYHGSIAGCIEAYMRQYLNDRIESADDMELRDLVTLLVETKAECVKLIEEATGGK